jgi:hypothetical protein
LVHPSNNTSVVTPAVETLSLERGYITRSRTHLGRILCNLNPVTYISASPKLLHYLLV